MQRILHEGMKIDESESLFCLVCDSRLNVGSSLNVFYTYLPKNGELLASFAMRLLHPSSANLEGTHVCLRCYDLFKDLEQAQWTVDSVSREILHAYGSRIAKTCQNDENEISVEKIEPTNSERIDENNEFDALVLPPDAGESNVVTNENVNSHVTTIDNFQNIEKSNLDSIDNIIGLVKLEMADDKAVEMEEKPSENGEKGIDDEFSKVTEFSFVQCGNDFADKSEGEDTRMPENDGLAKKSGRISKYSQKPLKYACTMCDKKWRTSAELKTHVKSHSDLRPYMCEICGQAYKHKNALEIHVGMHNGVSPYKCEVCNKCFTQKGALMRHLPMHTGETPYQCELCGKRFVHHTSYNMHALSHTGKKSYQCHVCDLSLLSTSHLKRHMRVHTGEKPHSCSLCGKSFAERYNLFSHQKIHHPSDVLATTPKKNSLKCKLCNETFDKKEKLEEHAREHEKNDTMAHENWREIDYRNKISDTTQESTILITDGSYNENYNDNSKNFADLGKT